MWLLITIFATLVIFAIVFFLIYRKKKLKPDYYMFFIIGLTWIAIGVPLKNYAFSIIGLILFIISLIHRKEWKKRKLSDLSPAERKSKLILMIILGILVLMAFVMFLIF